MFPLIIYFIMMIHFWNMIENGSIRIYYWTASICDRIIICVVRHLLNYVIFAKIIWKAHGATQECNKCPDSQVQDQWKCNRFLHGQCEKDSGYLCSKLGTGNLSRDWRRNFKFVYHVFKKTFIIIFPFESVFQMVVRMNGNIIVKSL